MLQNEFLNRDWVKARQNEILREMTGERGVQPRFDTPKVNKRDNKK